MAQATQNAAASGAVQSQKSVTIKMAQEFNLPEYGSAERVVPEQLAENGHIDRDYVFVPAPTRMFAVWNNMREHEEVCPILMLHGPSGTGKSTLPEQFFSRLRIPFRKLGAHKHMDVEEVIGGLSLKEGSMVYKRHALLQAYEGGYPLIINEWDLLDPALPVALNDFRDSRTYVSPQTGYVHRRKQGFGLVLTSNSSGRRDLMGHYAERRNQDMSFKSGVVSIEIGYPPEAAEVAIAEKYLTFVPDDNARRAIASRMVQIGNKLRSIFAGNADAGGSVESLSQVFTTRELIHWCKAIKYLGVAAQAGDDPMFAAFNFVFIDKLGDPAEKAATKAIFEAVFAKP